MATTGGANTVVDGLVFGYDTGYPLVSGSSETYKFNKGEPTETFDVGDMTPSSPNTFFTSSASYDSNLHGSEWDWSFYPNSNPSAEGGMEWHPNIEGPGFRGAWLMKKRPGGNSESNFSGNQPGAIESTSAYTVSVWCKTDQASCFRIHINTTKNGSSYWGYSSGYHTGGGEWERLSVTVPASEGNTNIGTIRCQAIGTTVTADAYFRNYQVEKNTHPTPFLLGGTRSVSGSLIDLTRTSNIDLSNVSFDSNAQMTFDGTDDVININFPTLSSDSGSIEVVVSREGTTSNSFVFAKVGDSTNRYYLRQPSSDTFDAVRGNPLSNASFGTLTLGKYYHLVMTWDASTVYAYKNGVLQNTNSYTNPNTDISDAQIGDGPGSNIAMKLPILKLHNRTLTAQEVLQNYNAVKERFSL